MPQISPINWILLSLTLILTLSIFTSALPEINLPQDNTGISLNQNQINW